MFYCVSWLILWVIIFNLNVLLMWDLMIDIKARIIHKVLHDGLLFKIKPLLPHLYFNFFKSYLSERTFQIKFQDIISSLYEINSGVPQGSVLGPVLYLYNFYKRPYNKSWCDYCNIRWQYHPPYISSRSSYCVTYPIKSKNHLHDISTWLKQWKVKMNQNQLISTALHSEKMNFCSHVF